MMLSSAVSLLLHYRGLPSLRRQPLLQTIYCLLDQQLNEATAQQAWGQSVASLPLILPLFTISFCNRQPAGCWTSRTGAQIPAFSQERRGVSYCQSTRDSHSCTRHWLPVWQRGRGCSLLRGTMKEQKPAPVVVGLQEEDILDTCPWQRPAAPDAQGLGTSGVLQRPGGWQQSPCSGALRCPVPSPRPGSLVLCHLPSHSHSPGCSPIITSGVPAISCFTWLCSGCGWAFQQGVSSYFWRATWLLRGLRGRNYGVNKWITGGFEF